MASYDDDLLAVARGLLGRRTGQRGKLSSARIRRSISTSYYALFHFLVDEAGLQLIGTRNDLRRRRRILARSFEHNGVKTTLEKVKGSHVDKSFEDYFRGVGTSALGAVACPVFVQSVAGAFLDAHAKRQDADYDLNKPLSETDARLLRLRVRRAIRGWRASRTPADRDFKSALCMLMLLGGKMRR